MPAVECERAKIEGKKDLQRIKVPGTTMGRTENTAQDKKNLNQ